MINVFMSLGLIVSKVIFISSIAFNSLATMNGFIFHTLLMGKLTQRNKVSYSKLNSEYLAPTFLVLHFFFFFPTKCFWVKKKH
jgi:hypothetical protein